MKRLLTAIAAVVVVLTASAKITDRLTFESGSAGFEPSVEGEDSSAVKTYDSDEPGNNLAVYDINGFGGKYLSLDTGDATLWRTNEHNAAYFDMVVKFTPSALGDEPTVNQPSDDKIIVYQNADSNIVVICADSSSFVTNIVTTKKLDAGTWARLTICSDWNTSDLRFYFKVYIDGVQLGTADNAAMEFRSLTIDTAVRAVGFSGSGALDNFVARTTDPFFSGTPGATIANGQEKYSTLEDALDDVDADTVITLGDHHLGTIQLARGKSCKLNLNGKDFGGFTVDMDNSCDALKVTPDGDITTYEAVAGVAYINNRPNGFATYYASVAEAMLHCDCSNLVSIVNGTNCTETVNIPAGKTLYLYEAMGTFSGTFDGPGTVFMSTFPNKYAYGSMVAGPANGATLFEPTWTGTFQVGWNPGDNRFVFNDFGNANSTVELACTHNSQPYPAGEYMTFEGFPSGAWGAYQTGDGAPTILPAIKLSSGWTISAGGGWKDTSTVIPKLTGSGDFTVNATYSRTYRIESIEGYTGTLTTYKGYSQDKGYGYPFIVIGDIVGTTAYDVCLVKATQNSMDDFWCTNLNNTTVNSAPANLAVGTYNDVTGIYKARAAATVDGVATGYRTVEEAVVAATNSIDSATQPPSLAIYDGSSFSEEGWTSTGEGVYVFDNHVKARIGDTPYFSLTAAIAAAEELDPAPVTIDIVAKVSETVVIPANVTVDVPAGGLNSLFNCTFSGSGALRYSEADAPIGVKQQLQSNGWTGTYIADYDVNMLSMYDINEYGNANSTFEIAEDRVFSGYVGNTTGAKLTINPTVKVSGSLDVNKEYNNLSTNEFRKITGTGTVVFNNSQGVEGGCYSVGTLEDWDGTLTVQYSSDQLITIGEIKSGSGTVTMEYAPSALPEFGSDWQGTYVADYDITANNDFDMNAYGVSGSTFEVATGRTLSGYIYNNGEENSTLTILPTLKVSGTVCLNDGYTNKDTVFSKVTGSGTFNYPGKNSWNDNQPAVFGHKYAIASLENWNGELAVSKFDYYKYFWIGSIVSGTGTVSLANAPSSAPASVGADWRGTVVVGWSPSSAFNPNNYGNANSVVALAGGFSPGGYFGTGNVEPIVIQPTIRIDSYVYIQNGFSMEDDSKLVTFSQLTGTNTLSSYGSVHENKYVYYKINTLRDFRGALELNQRTRCEIENVILASSPVAGTRVIPVTVSDYYASINSPAYTVAGSEEPGRLVYANINSSKGLYLAVAQVGAKCYATLAEAAAAANGASFTKLADTDEAIPEGWSLNGDTYSLNTYTITFVYGVNGESSTTANYAYGTTPVAPSVPAVDGYQITWPTFAAVTAATTYTAVYTASPYTVTYTLTAESAAGIGAAPAQETYYVTTATPYVLTQPEAVSGYTFSGWYDNSGLTGSAVTEFAISSAALENKTFYGKFTQNEPETPTIEPDKGATVDNVEATTEQEAENAVTIVQPSAATYKADPVDYQTYFKKTATEKSAGVWTVKAELDPETVVEPAMTSAAAIVDGTSKTGKVGVPRGLYYKITTMTGLDGTGSTSPLTGWSDGNGIMVPKPGEAQGFIKVQIGADVIQ